MRSAAILGIGMALVSGSSVLGTVVQGTIAQPSLDRWMYAFNPTPGTRPEAAVFGAILVAGFDDRDAEMLVAFDTTSLVPAGRGADGYTINSLKLRLRVSQGGRFQYDPTFDAVETSYLTTDAQYVADADVGKPIEVWPVGYRNGFTAFTFLENSPFSPFGFGGPWQNVRNVYPIAFDSTGTAFDVSNQVKNRQAARGLGIGLATSPVLNAGDLVPADAEFTFEISNGGGNPAGVAYLQESLNQGRLVLSVSSLHAASGGPGGGTSNAYPVFYTKENPVAPVLGYAGQLDIDANVRRTSDIDGSGGTPDTADIAAFFELWLAGDPAADFDDSEGTPDTNDIETFFSLWLRGL